MKISDLPKEFVNQAKELGVEVTKPASKEGIRKVALGAAGAGVISPFYSRGFDWLWNKSKFKKGIWYYVAKIGIPLGISALALKTKFPGGNLLCGSMVGVGLLEGGKAAISGLSGKLPALPNKSDIQLAVQENDGEGYYTK